MFSLFIHRDVDLCCPAHDYNVDLWSWDIKDTLPRISCDISMEEFKEKYLVPRKPVMLTGCMDEWQVGESFIKCQLGVLNMLPKIFA